MVMHHHFFLWCCCNEEGDSNKLPSPSSLCLRIGNKRRCWVLMLKVWEVCLEMQHHGCRRMKIYKKWFDPPILHMHNDWRLHGMSKIGIKSPLKQVKHKNWHMYWISMNLYWFMEGKDK
jgi:hypothetical protein